MTGELPRRPIAWTATGPQPFVLPAPRSADVVLEILGSALGAAPGAEVVGRVVATGEAASDWLDRIVVAPRLLPCGECPACRRGHVTRCGALWRRGAVQSHETVPARFLLAWEPPLPPLSSLGIEPWRLAALADAAAAPYGAVVRAQIAAGDLCLIIGGGVRGCFAAAIARAKGAQVGLLDVDPERRQRASRAGARFLLDGVDLDGPAAREALLAEAGAAGVTAAGLSVIETTGKAAGRRRAVSLADGGARIVLLGDGDGNRLSIDAEALAGEVGEIVGAGPCHPDLLPELAALLAHGELPLTELVSAVPFDRYAETVGALRAGRLRQLPILVPETT